MITYEQLNKTFTDSSALLADRFANIVDCYFYQCVRFCFVHKHVVFNATANHLRKYLTSSPTQVLINKAVNKGQ